MPPDVSWYSYEVLVVVGVLEYQLAHDDVGHPPGVVRGHVGQLPDNDVDQDVEVVGVKQVSAVPVAEHVKNHLK